MTKEKLTSFPKQAQLFLTEVCGEGCPYCPYGNLSPKEREKFLLNELSIKEWQKTVKFLYKKMNVRLFFLIGGEPSLKNGLEKLLKYIKKNLPSATVVLSTSGVPLLRNPKLMQKLINSGLKKIAVSVNGINGNLTKINLDQELTELNQGKERKSYLGLCFINELRKKYPKIKFTLSANCIVNKKTLPDIINTYKHLAKQKVFLNLCPEQTICFKTEESPIYSVEDKRLLSGVIKKLIAIKSKMGNYLVPSIYYLQSLATAGINQLYQCSSECFPNTINIASDGSIPFCIWRKGNLGNEYNILDFVLKKKTYNDWLKTWLKDKDGSTCSCSWSFLDRAGGFGISNNSSENNFWLKYTKIRKDR